MKSFTERPHRPPLTAEHYRQYRKQIATKGITKRAHATSTKNAIRSLKVRLKRFCELMNYDLLIFLTRGEKEEQYVNVDLKRLYNLDTSMAEKPVMNIDDIYLILYHHWVVDTATFPDGRQRLQIDFLELLTAGTATRPAALVYVKRNEKRIKGRCIGEDESEEEEKEDDKTLCYKDVTLLLLPNPGRIRDLLAMEVTCWNGSPDLITNPLTVKLVPAEFF